MKRLGGALSILAVLGFAACKKSEAPAASEAPKSQAVPAAEQAPAPSAAPAAAPEPAPPPTVGSTQGTEEPKKDQSRAGLTAEPTTVAEAEKALDQAVLDLNQLAGAKGGKGAGAATPLAAGDSRCPEACKAMDSLRRAAAAVCRLAGDGNGRCTRAKNIVKESESRVAVCKCEPAKD